MTTPIGALAAPLTRRTVLVRSLAAAGLLALAPTPALAAATALVVGNVTGLYPVEVARIVVPRSPAEIVRALRQWPGQVAIGGARYSMGGQTAIAGGLHLDMRSMRRLVWLRPQERRVRVEAGMRWRDLHDLIDPHDLAVKTMQSYANFSVGGAVAVNAHGRYVGHGPVGGSVRALQIVVAVGSVLETSPTLRGDLFAAAIGGYGAIGVITEVELDLAANVRIEREVVDVALTDYLPWFKRRVLGDADAVLHNADLTPPDFVAPVCTTWRRSAKPLTEPARLVARGSRYPTEQAVLFAMTELPGGSRLRGSLVRPLMENKPAVQWLNHEASHDVAELEPLSRSFSTYALQEYFVPERHLEAFAREMAKTLREARVSAVNVSIRHAPADTVSLLKWAREDVFSFVLYYKQRTSAAALEAVGNWTRRLIDLVIAHEGCHYLPYQLQATRAQFEAAYPMHAALRAIKREIDPDGRFSNSLLKKYLS